VCVKSFCCRLVLLPGGHVPEPRRVALEVGDAAASARTPSLFCP
jgi:hypothetical protein